MNELYVSMYHYVRDLAHSRYPGIKGLDTGLFEQQLDFFSKNFNVVKMEDVIEAVCAANRGEDRQILPERALLLTFDDGYIDNYVTVFPMLKRYGFQGSFFVPGMTFTEHVLLDVNKIHFIMEAVEDTSALAKEVRRLIDERRGTPEGSEIPPFEELYEKYGAKKYTYDLETDGIFVKRVLQKGLPHKIRSEIASELFAKYVGIPEEVFSRELYMSMEQMKLMKAEGMYFGLHGYEHGWLGEMDEESMKRDIDRALEVCAPILGTGKDTEEAPWVMNYPYGSYNDATVEYVRSRGCVLGFSVEVRIAVPGQDDSFTLPRFDCNDFPPKSERYRDF